MSAQNFKVTLRIQTKEGSGPVHFKPDGQRFEHAHTVKLNASTDYELSFNVKPALHIEFV